MKIKEVKKSIQDLRRRNNNSKTRVFIWPDESIRENLENRRNRPHRDWKPFVENALNMFGINFERVGWSQKAGCQCGCSPGFVVFGDDRPGYDISVYLEA